MILNFVIKEMDLKGRGFCFGDHFKTLEGMKLLMLRKQNNPFIIEQKPIGKEFSLFSFTDSIMFYIALLYKIIKIF